MATLPQLIALEMESMLYDQIHKLLGKIASDYNLDHGLLVDTYLIEPRGKSPPPQYIYAASDGSVAAECPGAPVKAPKPKKAKKAKSDSESDDREGKCTSLTAKGTPCKNKAFGGGCTCRVHTAKEGAEAKEPKVKAKRGRKSKAKKEPEHNHALDELAGSDCELCETHGNPMEGEQEFEIAPVRAKEEVEEEPYDEDIEEQIRKEMAAAISEGEEEDAEYETEEELE
jgi:hypothetical protein